MKTIKNKLDYFTKLERILWFSSLFIIVFSFIVFDRHNYITLSASLIGVTSLLFNAKANPIGQLLMVIFSLLYGIISYGFAYYGEMITYLGMSMPMAIVALITWMRHPFDGNKAEVKVASLTSKDKIVMLVSALLTTIVFYFILSYFNTANLWISTLSITTSFLAVYLTYKRSPFFAIAYAANDIVLIVLWVLASFTNSSYISVVVCFLAFFVNDIYGYYNWRNIAKRQANPIKKETDK